METGSFCLKNKGCPKDLVEGYGKNVALLNHSKGECRTENQGLDLGVKVAQFSEKSKMCLSQLKLMRPGSMIEWGDKEKAELGVGLPKSACTQISSVLEVSVGPVWVVSKRGLPWFSPGS